MVRHLLAAAVLPGLVGPAPAAPPPGQRLADFRRVVLPDDPRPVQAAAAAELARYVGRITGRDVAVVPAARYDPKADGLTFFVGDAAAKAALGLDLGPWK